MGKLTIHTVRYGAEAEALVAKTAQLQWKHIEASTSAFGVAWRGDEFIKGLFLLLFDACVAENAVYKHSPKLRAAANEMKGGKLYYLEERELRAFLRASKTINIEGYIAFRLSDLRERLDLMIFHILREMQAREI